MNPGNWSFNPLANYSELQYRNFVFFACFGRSQNIQQNIEGTKIHSQLLSEKLPGNCLVIVVDLEPSPVWSWPKFPKSTGCVDDVPGVSVFYGVQSLKELLGV